MWKEEKTEEGEKQKLKLGTEKDSVWLERLSFGS
jgi:hypothetical protein